VGPAVVVVGLDLPVSPLDQGAVVLDVELAVGTLGTGDGVGLARLLAVVDLIPEPALVFSVLPVVAATQDLGGDVVEQHGAALVVAEAGEDGGHIEGDGAGGGDRGRLPGAQLPVLPLADPVAGGGEGLAEDRLARTVERVQDQLVGAAGLAVLDEDLVLPGVGIDVVVAGEVEGLRDAQMTFHPSDSLVAGGVGTAHRRPGSHHRVPVPPRRTGPHHRPHPPAKPQPAPRGPPSLQIVSHPKYKTKSPKYPTHPTCKVS